jgi:hypothetical protein
MAANQGGKLNLAISLNRSQNVASNAASSSGGVNAITLKSNGGIGFTAEARVVNDGGNQNIVFRLSSIANNSRQDLSP